MFVGFVCVFGYEILFLIKILKIFGIIHRRLHALGPPTRAPWRAYSVHHSFTGLQNFRPRARHAQLYTLLWVGRRREGPVGLKAKKKAAAAIRG